LLVQTRVVDCERGLAADRRGLLDRLLRERRAGARRQDRERRQDLGRCRDGDRRARPATFEERDEPRRRAADLRHGRRVDHEWLAAPEQLLHGTCTERLRPEEDRAGGLVEARVGNRDRTREQHLAAVVRHADERHVRVEHVHDGAGDGVERRFEREALRERARDLVERAHLPRRRLFGFERTLALVAETLGLFVKLRVLHGDGELRCECSEQRRLVLCGYASARREDGDQPDHLVANKERDGGNGFDPGFGRGIAGTGEARVERDVVDSKQPARAERAECQVE
jgi:hypothetical protein